MLEQNIKNVIIPLIDKGLDRNNKNILDKLKDILSGSIYFKCLIKLSPTYGESILNSFITSLTFKKYSKDYSLLNYNEPVTKLYFIFKGKLNLYRISMEQVTNNLDIISKENHIEKEEFLNNFCAYTKKYLKSINIENIFVSNYKTLYSEAQDENEKSKNKNSKNFESLFKNIINNNLELDCTLSEGNVFGEQFLYNNIPFCNCVLTCGTDCIIGELSKEEYDKIYKRYNKIERSFITNFLVNLKLFKSVNNFFSKLQQCLIKKYFSKNEIIFKQGEKFRAFYLIRNGKVNLSLKINRTVNCDLEPEIIMGKLMKERFTSNKTYITKGKYSEKIDYNLITLQNGEFLGDIEYLEKNGNYLYTAQCTEDSILFEIDIELFEHFIANNNNIKDNLKVFYTKIEEKMDILQDRIYSIRMNNSAIKKSDYILSKNKFTKNILQGYPLKEDKKVNLKFSNISNNNTAKKKSSNDNENFYLNMISPFLKRYSSASKSKKFSKIKFNNDFFKNKNRKELFLKTKKIYKLRENKDMNSKLQNSNSVSVTKVSLSNKILTDINETKNPYRILSKSKIKNLIERNNNFNFSMKTDNISSNIENLKKKKIPKIVFNINKTERESEKLYNFMDADLIFSKSNINQNIPKIIKTTKETNIFKQRYNKVRNNKLNKYYFKSPKEKAKIFN